MKPMEAESVQDESLHNFATLNLESIFFSSKKEMLEFREIRSFAKT